MSFDYPAIGCFVWQPRRCCQFWLLVYLHPIVTLLVRHSIQMLLADVKVWIKPGSNNKSMHDVSKQWDDTHNGAISGARYTTIMAQLCPASLVSVQSENRRAKQRPSFPTSPSFPRRRRSRLPRPPTCPPDRPRPGTTPDLKSLRRVLWSRVSGPFN